MIEININNICKNYGANKIFDYFSLVANTREIVSLIGSNGCGKSTLLKMIIKELY